MEFPSFSIQAQGPIIWKGAPLKIGNLQEVLFAARKARYFSKDDTFESSRKRWEQVGMLLNAVIAKMPGIEMLDEAIPVIPDPPKPQSSKKPKRSDFIRAVDYHKEMAAWNSAADDFGTRVQDYEKALPDFIRRVKIWECYEGEIGIHRLRDMRAKLCDVLKDIDLNLRNPYGAMLELSFEILPPGLWNSGALVPHLGGNGWDEQKIVPERIDHLVSLNPQMVFRGNVYRGYKDYLLFLFGKGGPAVLETPIHGNATYVLHREWLELCKKSKGELIKHSDVKRIIHHDMAGWRRDVCRALQVKPPGHSNEY